MAFEVPKTDYSGTIREIEIGREGTITLGGENSYPFHLFEGAIPHPPKIAFEIYDTKPEGWPDTLLEIFQDVMGDPVSWAKKCVNDFGAEIICLRLFSIDPNGMNKNAEDVVPIVKSIADAITVPMIVWGCENDDKDAEILPRIAESCHGQRLIIGPATEKNYKKIGAAAIAYDHTVVASTPIDINLAKQLNILLGELGVPDNRILVDPNIGGSSLGYGIEYTYSVMERIRQAALTQQDERLQFPTIGYIATDVWKKREVLLSEDEHPKLGNINKRGIIFEALTGITLLLAGTDLLVMRHPEAIKLVRNMVSNLTK